MDIGTLAEHLRTVRSELQRKGVTDIADHVLKAIAELEQVANNQREMTQRDDSLGM